MFYFCFLFSVNLNPNHILILILFLQVVLRVGYAERIRLSRRVAHWHRPAASRVSGRPSEHDNHSAHGTPAAAAGVVCGARIRVSCCRGCGQLVAADVEWHTKTVRATECHRARDAARHHTRTRHQPAHCTRYTRYVSYSDVVSVKSSRARDGLETYYITSRLGSRTIASRRDDLCRRVTCIAVVKPSSRF